MTSQFNLLPARYVERMAERRAAGVVGAGLLALVVVLASVSLLQGRHLAQTERAREEERARTAELQTRRRALAPFRQVVDGIVGRERLLAGAMQTHVSWSTVLTSLSASFPDGASLTSLTAESTVPPFGAVPPIEVGADNRVIGTAKLKGYSLERFTPGVERMLQLLDGVRGLSHPRLEEGTADKIGERPVTKFEGGTLLDGAGLSGRYTEGLPPEHDVKVPVLGAREPAASPASASGERASK